MMADELSVNWCGDPAEAGRLAQFFVQQVDPDYLSHSEMQMGRAIDPGHWSIDLERVVAGEIRGAAAGAEPGKRIAVAR